MTKYLKKQLDESASSPARVAARVMLERSLGTMPELKARYRDRAMVVVIEVPAPGWVDPIGATWLELTVDHPLPVEPPPDDDDLNIFEPAPESHWKEFLIDGSLKSHHPGAGNDEVVKYLDRGFGLYGVAPCPERHLPRDLLRAADYRMVIARLDREAITEIATVLFGARPSAELPDDVAAVVEIEDLSLARRSGEDADRFIARLRVFAESRVDRPSLTLDDLMGMGEATAWGRSLARDLAEYRRGALPWSAVDRGALVYGPPGTGKTTFARALAGSCGVPLVTGGLAEWQAAGHLGDLLRAMRGTFSRARATAPCILFIDEIDSFGSRSSFVSEYRDYSIQVVNGLLEELDGAGGREGVVVIGACNHPERLDPALVRSGRLDRAIPIPLPDRAGLIAILRHRLGPDLADTDLSRIATLALGGTGADVERWVRGARRCARAAGRSMVIEDLLSELQGAGHQYPQEIRERSGYHEAGHTVATLINRPNALIAVSLRDAVNLSGGYTITQGDNNLPMTKDRLQFELMRLLAGRAAEEVIFGSVSSGSGGSNPGSDLGQATSLATAALTTMGLGSGDEALVWLGTEGSTTSLLSLRGDLSRQVTRMLGEAYSTAKSLIEEHRELVELIARELLEREILDGDQVRALAAGLPGASKKSQQI